VIPARFDYLRPASLDEALAALAERGEDAKALAGGQSLIPLLRLRMTFPGVLVDLGRLGELRGVREEAERLVIGAMTTHHDIVANEAVRRHCPLLAEATATVADRQVRHLGTLGGSLSHADPAGDLPAVALALDAGFVIAGAGGRQRTVPASEFFRDYLQTALEPDELLVEVVLPKFGPEWGVHYEKFHRVAQAWAIVGVAAAVRRSNGAIAEARIGLTNMGPTPLRARATEAALAGAAAEPGAISAAAAAAAEGTNPPDDLNGQADYRRHLARVLTGRAVSRAAG
jgi:carbon-monoxide dehydrogenase medium subunit